MIALIHDCCAAFNLGEFDAETIHRVNVRSLEREFAEIVDLSDVLNLLV